MEHAIFIHAVVMSVPAAAAVALTPKRLKPKAILQNMV